MRVLALLLASLVGHDYAVGKAAVVVSAVVAAAVASSGGTSCRASVAPSSDERLALSLDSLGTARWFCASAPTVAGSRVVVLECVCILQVVDDPNLVV